MFYVRGAGPVISDWLLDAAISPQFALPAVRLVTHRPVRTPGGQPLPVVSTIHQPLIEHDLRPLTADTRPSQHLTPAEEMSRCAATAAS